MPAEPPGRTHELLVFLFTDLVDSTSWKQKLGDVAYADSLLRPHNQIARRLMAELNGVERNFTGDGFLLTFPAPSDAVVFALRLHDALDNHAWDAGVARIDTPKTRIGIHLGEAVAYDDAAGAPKQLAGQAVDLAARIMGLAAGRQTLLTRHAFDSARQYVRDETLSWLMHGQYRCKGADDPLEVGEVGVAGRSPLTPPPDSDKARRLRIDADDDTGSWRPAVGIPIPRRPDWRVEKELGVGGFGEVWLARNQRTKERRVFKFCFDVDRLRSFKRELTFFKLLRSELGDRPDIARLYEVSVDAAPYFLESEYVEAGNLGHWADAQGGIDKVPLPTRLRLIEQIARAVAAAHSLGIIHKDLKPSNVLIKVDRNGEPQSQLNDFGIGVLADRTKLLGAHITEAGFTESVMFGNDSSRTGTRLYSPPEASLGKPATTAADVYALGVMLFQMVAGDFGRPLGIGWEDLVAAEQTGDPLTAELLRDDIKSATLAEPAKRLPGAAALADRLANLDGRREALLAERRQQELVVLAAERERRVKRLRVLLAGSATVLLLVGILAAVAWQAKTTADTKKGEAEKALMERSEALIRRDAAITDLQASEANLKYNLGVSNMLLANAAYENNNVVLAQENLDKVPEEQRKFEWNYRQKLVRGGLFTFYGHDSAVSSVAFSPDGTRIVTGSWDQRSKVWDARTGQALLDLKGHTQEVSSVAFSPDGTRIVTGSYDQTAKVWDSRTGRALLELKGHTDRVCSVAFSPDGTRIITGSTDRTARLWDARNGQALLNLKGHTHVMSSVAFSPDGTRIVTGSSDTTAKVWDARNGQVLLDLKGHTFYVSSVAFSPDGTRIVTGSWDQRSKVWDARTGQVLLDLKDDTQEVSSVAFSPDGTRIVTGSYDQTAKVWDSRTGRALLELKGHTDRVCSVAFSPDGTRIITGSTDRTARVWDARNGQALLDLKGHTNVVSSVAFSPDGTRILTGSLDLTAKLWDARTGQVLLDLNEHMGSVRSVAFSPDGTRIITGSIDRTARVWDARNGQALLELKDPGGRVQSVAFSPDGARIVMGSTDKTAIVWDARTGQALLDLKGHTQEVSSVAFSPDGTRIVTGSYDQTAKVWDSLTGRALLDLKAHTNLVWSVAFSPDGTRIVTGSSDKTARVWDARTGQTLLDLKGHTNAVSSAAFSPDGTRVVTGSHDQTAKLWDARNGQVLLDLKEHPGSVASVAFSPDGTRIVSGCYLVTAKVWDARIGQELKGGPTSERPQAGDRRPDDSVLAFHNGNRVTLGPLKLNAEELECRLIWTAPNCDRSTEAFGGLDATKDQFAKQFHLDRLLAFPQNFGNVELLNQRTQLTGDARLAVRARRHTPGVTTRDDDAASVRALAAGGDRLAQRLVSQELIRDGKADKAIPLLFWCLAGRMRNSPPVEELLIAQVYHAMKRPEEARKYFALATEWLDRPRQPIAAANIITHAFNPIAAVAEAFKPIDDPRHNRFDWESWYECEVFRKELETTFGRH